MRKKHVVLINFRPPTLDELEAAIITKNTIDYDERNNEKAD